MGDIAAAIDGAIEHLRGNPGESRYRDSLATARLGDDLRVEVTGPDGESLVTDMPKGIGGRGEAPSPGFLLRAAVASCDASLIAMRAAQQGITLSRLEVEVDSESDDLGILGLDESVPAGPLSVRVRVHATAEGASDDLLRAAIEWAVAHCPSHDALGREVPVELEIATG